MRILVTGGAGFVGSHVVDAYVAAGHEVHVLDDLSTGRRDNLNDAATLHEMDIRAAELTDLVAALEPEVINHHAAQASVKVSTKDPEYDLAVNGGGTANLALAAAAHGVRKIIYSSSGGTAYGQPAVLPVPEGATLQPESPYGVSKLAGEEYLRMVARTAGLESTTLRYGNAFGPRQDPHGEAGVVAIFAERMLRAEPCTIDGDGEQQKDYVYVGDLARANVLALAAGSGGVFNLGTGRGTSVNALHRALQDATGDATTAVHGPPRPGDIRKIYVDATAARQAFGWEPEISLDEGLRLTIESLRQALPA